MYKHFVGGQGLVSVRYVASIITCTLFLLKPFFITCLHSFLNHTKINMRYEFKCIVRNGHTSTCSYIVCDLNKDV